MSFRSSLLFAVCALVFLLALLSPLVAVLLKPTLLATAIIGIVKLVHIERKLGDIATQLKRIADDDSAA